MIRLYVLKRGFDAQKAERWFKERRVPAQVVDLSKAKIGPRELARAAKRVGVRGLVDEDARAWKECPVRFSGDDALILKALLDNPARLRLPIAVCGEDATVGYAPKIWETWRQE